MTDEELRALERRARASPDDREAGWAYGAALGRVGDRRRLYLEVSRLARGGDPRARRELAFWSEAEGPPLRRCGRARKKVLEGAAESVLVATERALVLKLERRLEALDPGSLETLWTLPDRAGVPWQGSAHALGDEIIRTGADGLALHDARTGEVRARSDLDRTARVVGCDGDRALASVSRQEGDRLRSGHLALDLGEGFGRVLWTRSDDGSWENANVWPGLGKAGCQGDWSLPVALHDLETGNPAGELTPAPGRTVSLLAHDGEGMVLSSRRFATDVGPGRVKPDDAVEERDFAGTAVRWSVRAGMARDALLPDDTLCLASTNVGRGLELRDVAAGFALTAIERATGRIRWRKTFWRQLTTRFAQDFAIASHGPVAYAAMVHDDGIHLEAFDLATGDRLYDRDLDEPAKTTRWVRLVPRPGCLVVLVSTVQGEGSMLFRFEE